jgi:exonuclease III
MDNIHRRNSRQWKVLCWNIRGINSVAKWTAIRSKISESKCDIMCIQETKCAHFDQSYLRNFCGPQFDRFEFTPSQGLSGGTLIVWKSSRFLG